MQKKDKYEAKKTFSEGFFWQKISKNFLEISRLRTVGPVTYDIKHNPQYAHLAKAFELSLCKKTENEIWESIRGICSK